MNEKRLLKRRRRTFVLGTVAVIMMIAALISETIYFSDFEYRLRTRKFNRVLAEKERIMEECLSAMKPILAKEEHHGSVNENNLFSVADQNKITILEYIDNKLIYWSNNDFDVPAVINDTTFSRNLIFLQNGWFLPRIIRSGSEKIVGLLRIHTEYGFENDIIKSGFERDFKITGNVGFSTDRNASEFHVVDLRGKYLFSLLFPEVKVKTYFLFIPLLLWISTFLSLILLAIAISRNMAAKGHPWRGGLFMSAVFSGLYAVILFTGKPQALYQTEMFSPYRFTFNTVIPSLGHMLVLGFLLIILAVFAFRNLPVRERDRGSKAYDIFRILLFLLPGVLMISVFHLIFNQLVATSNINFEPYKVLGISKFTIVGFSATVLLVLTPLLYLMKLFQAIRKLAPWTIITAIIISSVFFVPLPGQHSDTLIPLVFFYLVITTTIWWSVKGKVGMLNIAIVFSLIMGLYSLYMITVLSEIKTTENLKIKAVSLSSENDPDAEALILDQWPLISQDTTLRRMMQNEYFAKDDVERISRYLKDNYFNGYWNNFNFNIVLCRDDESLNIGQGSDVYENCFDFFFQRIRLNGHRLTGTEFYFIDNQGGRSYYIGRLYFPTGTAVTNGLFIELYSDINIFQPGYSELLIDSKYHGYAGLKGYEFAKYINGDLVLTTGDYPYSKGDEEYVDKITDFRVFDLDGYRHVLYRNGNATVIISRSLMTFGDLVISFAYIFAFILLFSNIFILFIRKPSVRGSFILNFRQKLQLSFIGILLFAFVLVAVVVAYMTVHQIRAKHYENIREKLNSVYMEIDNWISPEKNSSSEMHNANYSSLSDLLIKLSNTFNIDINLYDLNGFLISTSRPEIFYRNLTSRRINNLALINLASLTRSEYIQKEKMGSLEYISAYVPFISADRRVIAYLNLPYFRMQSVLSKEISNLIVAIINFTLLLIVVTMGMAVFISGRLTSPLTMLGEGLASVGVGKKSEHLVYRGNDEIGELVRQYNRMVDEIEESAQKLANSEREYAWREMAKQIAHEIKNPLTPMKLNVQQLFKSWNDKAPGFEKLLERFTRNQIEYIDNLSSIATAFSSFAKMPGNNPAELDLLEQIRTTLELFKSTDNVSFSVNWPQESRVMVFADREHLNSVFANLIKNGIQAIPQDREGEIRIEISISADRVKVAIADNGEGIPDELRKKLFTPNFTTKSSGMGLGLSIVKKYVENADGRIWFESEPGRGSVFFVELPLVYTVEKIG